MTFTLERLAVGPGFADQLAVDARAGLTATPKSLPPKYFYDAVGSELFVQITELEEYYPTRAEARILAAVADEVMAAVAPHELLELGSGASAKTRLLLERLHQAGGDTYVAFDVSEDAVRAAADALLTDYPWLVVHGIVGDFDHHLASLPRWGRRLVAFLGSTIGNYEPARQVGFLRDVARMLDPGDAFLCGFDLVKDPQVLVRAYNDAAGVTAAFNRNVLAVLNTHLGGDFDLAAFEHVARWNALQERIEMWLRSRRAQHVHIAELDLEVEFEAGEEMLTEISCKFTRASAEARLVAAGLELVRWDTDAADHGGEPWFAVALARRG